MKKGNLTRAVQQSIPATFRLFLGLMFLLYGLAKLTFGQFGEPSPEAMKLNSEGFVMAWTFFGYSRAYEVFIGLGEVIAAILIMIPRTATLGALCYFPIILNVMVINYCFQIGVQDLSTVLTVMCFILLLLDRKKLYIFYANDQWKGRSS
ncbi:hypothetical protein FZC66_08270 [Priestia megaterium]|nr:hypothetical protein FZC66_08270 [Priestia megaterium]